MLLLPALFGSLNAARLPRGGSPGRLGPLYLLAALAGLLPTAIRADTGDITAVSSKVSDDYVRAKRADGTFEPEGYAFGEGGVWAVSNDVTMDQMHFLDVARTIAAPLAHQHYLPSRDPKNTKLLIMVYWGVTAGTGGGVSNSVAAQNLSSSQSLPPAPSFVQLPNGKTVSTGGTSDPRKSLQVIDENAVFAMAVENVVRDRADVRNARLLGFEDDLKGSRGLESTAMRFRQQDLMEEIEDSRYFVVLMAYDFQLLWKEKKHKLLWETRFSIREHRNDFGHQLAAMAQTAGRYFGQDSHGVVRKELPEGHVEIGDLKVIEFEPEKK
jgi:hypothetical protein